MVLYDKDDVPFTEFTPGMTGLSTPLARRAIPDEFVKLLLFTEDRSFYSHWGVDMRGMARAFAANVRALSVVQGGSTIPMQYAKRRLGIRRNNIATKAFETIMAVRITAHTKKDDILTAYCNSVRMGNNVSGIGRAARVYFRKELVNCSLFEFAVLAAVIREPGIADPWRHPLAAERKAKAILTRYAATSAVSADVLSNALAASVIRRPPERLFSAEHFSISSYAAARSLAGITVSAVYTTLDRKIQSIAEDAVRDRVSHLAKKHRIAHASVIIIDNRTLEVRAMVGSPDFDAPEGEINGVFIKRQPGSSMKPFVYAAAFEYRIATPATVLPDTERSFPSTIGKYLPRNYDERYHGPVRAAVALGSSYNVPAVWLLNTTGLRTVYEELKHLHFDSIDRPPQHYGLGLALGNADISLFELARAYAVFANSGEYRDASMLRRVRTGIDTVQVRERVPVRVFSRQTAFLITHILAEFKYKTAGFGIHSALNMPFPVAVKTGTSKDYRDNTVAGYTRNYTIGVWAGNFSGRSMDALPAAQGAGLIFRDIIAGLYNAGIDIGQADLTVPSGVTPVRICTLSGMRAHMQCRESMIEYCLADTVPGMCTWHTNGKTMLPPEYATWLGDTGRNADLAPSSGLHIVRPADKDVFNIDASMQARMQEIELSVSGDTDGVAWYINGRRYAEGKTVYWRLTPGDIRIEARGKNGADSVVITVVRK
ncbi:MAG: transglycosylase domain-containing protein [Spirochaetota bacterium]